MGHLRLGRLPKTKRWTQVVDTLEANPGDTASVARATIAAAEGKLRELGADPALGYCFWLLVRVTQAARSTDFIGGLRSLGIQAKHDASAFTFISQLADRARLQISELPHSGPFGELASLALRRTLSETVGERSQTLFGTTLEDIQAACRAYSSRKQFGVMSRLYFGDFLARSLRYFLNKELSNHVGPEHELGSV